MDRKTFTATLLLLHKSCYRRANGDGYAMLVTSITAILVFSMLSVYLFSTKLYRSSAGAIVDGASTFYAAESGLNRRSSQTHKKFEGFDVPAGVAPTGNTIAEKMANCMSNNFTTYGSGDLECRTQEYDYYEQADAATGAFNNTNKQSKSGGKSKYVAYSFVQPNPNNPRQMRIPAGQPFAGLNAQEYSFRVYSTAVRKNDAVGATISIEAQTLLHMDFNSRIIPLFQFAAFYENNLEINPSPFMSLNGPVHTNSRLFMAPGDILDLTGGVTSVGDMYASLEFVAGHSYTPNRLIRLGNGNTISSAPAWGAANLLISQVDIDNSSGQLRPNIDRLAVPQPGFLSGPGNNSPGEYYNNADLKVEFLPQANLSDIPFQVTVSKGGGSGSPATLSTDHLRSLRQPVLVLTREDDEQRVFCGGVQSVPKPIKDLMPSGKSGVVGMAMYGAILAQPNPVPFSSLRALVSDTGGNNLRTKLQQYLAFAGLNAGEINDVLMMTPADMVAVEGNCFVSAPFQVVNINDRREGRNIQTLQTNIQSLVAWNRDGRLKPPGPETPANYMGVSVTRSIYDYQGVNSTAPAQSFRRLLNLSSNDRTQGGFVWHFDINRTTYPYPNGQSPYGFAFTGGQDLPAPLTIATDQAIYLQGNYNNVDRKASATMGDTITVLSNACTNGDRAINCGDLLPGPVLPVATPTTVNAAFLSRTDLTDTAQAPIRYSGGLNNYMRMLENWQNVPFTYRGSFVSLGTPLEFSGRYQPGKLNWGNLLDLNNINDYYYYFPPVRNFSFDTDFNFAERLPPLTPKVVSLSQKVFRRDYDNNR